ncbi:transglutaminase-like domain-containing protein [Nocardioides nanhaiensis]|uniref:Transglutaminase-like domain-containing protein n=1 Tax=Nocardioides nanhaiensis TaxID=1476871 RepID=A0ABP8WET5_9ACTN
MRGAHRQRTLLAEDWYDVGLAGLLTATTLVGWAATYRGAGLWFFGLGAVLVGLAVAVTVVSLGGGAEHVTLALVLVYVVAAGPVGGGVDALWGLDALGAGTTGTLDGWRALVGTHPPLDAAGATLLPPAGLCLLAAGLSAALAMRSDVPGRPLLPQLVQLLVVLAAARAETVAVVAHGIGFVVLALVWLRVRTRQSESAESGSAGRGTTPGLAAAPKPGALPPTRSRGRGPLFPAGAGRAAVGPAMVAGAVVVALLLAGGTPLTERRVLRGSLPAYDPAPVRTPLDDFRDYTRRRPASEGNVFDARLLRVRGVEPGTRVRIAVLEAYDGERWSAAEQTDPARIDDRYLRLASTVDNPAAGTPAEAVVTALGGWSVPWVPTAGAVQGFTFLGAEREALTEQLRFDPAAGSGLVTTPELAPGTDYAARVRLPEVELPAPDDEPFPDLAPGLAEAGAFLDPAVEAWSAGAASPMEAVLQVARRLKRTGYYTDGAARGEEDYAAGHSQLRLGREFVLAATTAGNDEQYAAAMALMANRLGVPARVVVGAVLPGRGIVRGRDVEAWVELRVADGSWRTLPTAAFMGRRPPPSEEEERPAGSPPPQRIFPEQTPDDTSPPRQQPERPEPEPEDSADSELADSAEEGSGVLGTVLRWLLVVVLLVALVGLVPALKWWRRRRRRLAARPSDRVSGGWEELVDAARDLGTAVPGGLTRPAQAQWLEPGAGAAVGTMAERADVLVFAPDPPDDAEAERFWSLVEAERTRLTAARSPLRRLRALLNPASLLPRRDR